MLAGIWRLVLDDGSKVKHIWFLRQLTREEKKHRVRPLCGCRHPLPGLIRNLFSEEAACFCICPVAATVPACCATADGCHSAHMSPRSGRRIVLLLLPGVATNLDCRAGQFSRMLACSAIFRAQFAWMLSVVSPAMLMRPCLRPQQ